MVLAKNYETVSTFVKVMQRKLRPPFSGHGVEAVLLLLYMLLELTVGFWFQSKVSSSAVAEVSDKKKSEKDVSADAQSSDLFSIHNFDVTIDLNFPSRQCSSFLLVIFTLMPLLIQLNWSFFHSDIN